MSGGGDIPDRGSIGSEQRNPRTMSLDTLSVRECVDLLNAEDAMVAAAVGRAAPEIARFIEGAEPRMCAGGRLIYLGAGTSGRLGVLDASECPPTFQTPPEMVLGIIAGGDAALRRSSEGLEDDPAGAHAELDRLGVGAGDSVLGIAAGGTTPFVLGGLSHASSRGAWTGMLVCAPIAPPPGVGVLIIADTGPEPLTGSTRMKAGTATKMVLNTVSTTLMVRMGRVHENLMVDLRATNAKLRDRAARIISTLAGLPRPDALALLDRAQGSVKHAVVMARTGQGFEEADRSLAESGGRLRDALASAKGRRA